MRGRIRQLKPEIFLDDEFWALTQEHPDLPLFVAFLGLWCFADREGRFEWKPGPLKSQVLPYWQGDFRRVLDVLAEARLVLRYTVSGRQYGVIRSFGRHQMPNNREAPSVLPAPGSEDAPDESDRSIGFVYVATLGDGSVFKVGFSRQDPSKRINDLSNGSPEPLRLVEAIEGGSALEAQIHRALKRHNRHREWFAATDESVSILHAWFTRDPRVRDVITDEWISRADASCDAPADASPGGVEHASNQNQSPTQTPNPDSQPDPRPRPARAADARSHDEGRFIAKTFTMPSEEPPRAYLDEALMAAVKPEQAKSTWKHYWKAGLPEHGVEKLYPWLIGQALEYAKRTSRVEPSRASRPQEDPGIRGHERIEPQSEHRKLAEQYDLDLDDYVARLNRDPKARALGTIDGWRALTKVLEAAAARQQKRGAA